MIKNPVLKGWVFKFYGQYVLLLSAYPTRTRNKSLSKGRLSLILWHCQNSSAKSFKDSIKIFLVGYGKES